MLKKTVLILMSMLIILGLAGSASAAGPEPVICELYWLDMDGNLVFFPVEGIMTYNETAQVYNISCRYTFDFDSGEWLDFATMCSWLSWACNPSRSTLTIKALGWESPVGYTSDDVYQVFQNGKAKYDAQVAPGQCTSEMKSVSWTYLPVEGWDPGIHTYQFIEIYSDGSVWEYDPVEVMVDANAPLLDSHVRMGLGALTSAEGLLDTNTINPDQGTYFQGTYANGINIDDLKWLRDNMNFQLIIDGNDPIVLLPGPLVNNCSTWNNKGAYQRVWGYAR